MSGRANPQAVCETPGCACSCRHPPRFLHRLNRGYEIGWAQFNARAFDLSPAGANLHDKAVIRDHTHLGKQVFDGLYSVTDVGAVARLLDGEVEHDRAGICLEARADGGLDVPPGSTAPCAVSRSLHATAIWHVDIDVVQRRRRVVDVDDGCVSHPCTFTSSISYPSARKYRSRSAMARTLWSAMFFARFSFSNT